MSAQKGKRTKLSSDSSPDRSKESTAPKKAKVTEKGLGREPLGFPATFR